MTLTNSPQRKNPFGEAVVAHPFHFDQPEKLIESLRGVGALINTYWVRFDHRLFTHDQAVANTKVMFNAAKAAGVRRIVHVSITKSDIELNRPYFRGKAKVEQALMNLTWLLHPAACGAVREGRCAHQQHRLGAPPSAGIRRFRLGRVQSATHLLRRAFRCGRH